MKINTSEINRAVDCLKKGEVIAYPTEAIYGLGCDPNNIEAVSHLLRIKQRSIDKGFILVASDWKQIESLIEFIEPRLLSHILNTWPGPVTWLFPAKVEVPHWIRGKHHTIALRVSAHPIVQALCKRFDGPVISTSANVEGAPPARNYRAVKILFGDELAMIIKGSVGEQKNPTEIRDALTGEIIRSA